MQPTTAPATDRAAGKQPPRKPPVSKKSGGFARHIIEFDSVDSATYAAFSLPAAAMAKATARSPISWPAGQVPTPAPFATAPQSDAPLPQFDYLIVTWTVEEAKCLADTLTPGHPSRTAWYAYAHNFTSEF